MTNRIYCKARVGQSIYVKAIIDKIAYISGQAVTNAIYFKAGVDLHGTVRQVYFKVDGDESIACVFWLQQQ